MPTIFLGAEKAAEKAVGYAELYIKGLALLAFLAIVFPIPFLIWGVTTGQRLITSLTGLYLVYVCSPGFCYRNPVGDRPRDHRGRTERKLLRYRKFFVGIFSTGLFVSMLVLHNPHSA